MCQNEKPESRHHVPKAKQEQPDTPYAIKHKRDRLGKIKQSYFCLLSKISNFDTSQLKDYLVSNSASFVLGSLAPRAR